MSVEGVVIAVTCDNVGEVLSTVKEAPLVGVVTIAFPARSVPVDKVIVPEPSPLGTT